MNLLHHSNKKTKNDPNENKNSGGLSLSALPALILSPERTTSPKAQTDIRRERSVKRSHILKHTLLFFFFFFFYRQTWIPLDGPRSFARYTSCSFNCATHTHTHTHSPGTLPRCHRRLLPHLSGSVNGPSQVWKPLPRPLSSSLPPFPHVPLPPPFIPSFPPTTSFSVQTVKRKCVNLHGGQRLTLSPRPVQLSAFLRAEQKWMNEWIDVFGWWKLLPGHNCQGDAQLRWNMQNASILRKSSVFYLDCHGCSGKFHLLSV